MEGLLLSRGGLADAPIAGLPLHITLGTHHGRQVFQSDLLADVVFSILVATDVTLAVCLMPDHLQWLIVGSPDWSGRLRRFKSFSTSISWRCGHAGRLWQRSAADRVVQSEEDLRAVADRMVSHPLRTGLVEAVSDYPYQFSRWS